MKQHYSAKNSKEKKDSIIKEYDNLMNYIKGEESTFNYFLKFNEYQKKYLKLTKEIQLLDEVLEEKTLFTPLKEPIFWKTKVMKRVYLVTALLLIVTPIFSLFTESLNDNSTYVDIASLDTAKVNSLLNKGQVLDLSINTNIGKVKEKLIELESLMENKDEKIKGLVYFSGEIEGTPVSSVSAILNNSFINKNGNYFFKLSNHELNSLNIDLNKTTISCHADYGQVFLESKNTNDMIIHYMNNSIKNKDFRIICNLASIGKDKASTINRLFVMMRI